MAWPEGTPNWMKNQWGIIAGQVSQRATTAELINSLRPYAQASPEGWGPKGVIQLAQLRSMAVSIRTASEQIQKDQLTGTITDKHIAEAPWSRSPAQQTLAPKFMVRALVSSPNPEHIAGVPGAPAEVTQWVTQVTGQLPATLDTLVSNVITRAGETGSPPTPVTAVSAMEIIRE